MVPVMRKETGRALCLWWLVFTSPIPKVSREVDQTGREIVRRWMAALPSQWQDMIALGGTEIGGCYYRVVAVIHGVFFSNPLLVMKSAYQDFDDSDMTKFMNWLNQTGPYSLPDAKSML